MVQRKRRTDSKPPSNPVPIRKYLIYACGAAVIALAVWLASTIISTEPDKVTPEEEIHELPVVIEILNGTRVSGIAGRMSVFLMSNNIDSLIVGNADNKNFPETIIIERKQGFGGEISRLTGVRNLTFGLESDSDIAVTIILGSDYEQFIPFTQ